MKLLITGGCGFLGSNLAADASVLGFDVVVFDNLKRTGAPVNLNWLNNNYNIKFVYGDIRSFDDVSKVIQEIRPDIIFHLAGQVAMTTSIERPLDDFYINAVGSINLLESVRKFSPQCKIIYSSTNKVYGDLASVKIIELETRYSLRDYPDGINEDFWFEPHSPYGCSKGTADQYMMDYSRAFGLKTTVFRHSTMFGGRQFATFDQGWIGWFVDQSLRQLNGTAGAFSVSGTGKQVRDVLHVSDISRLYFSAVENFNILSGNVYNIGGGISNSLSIIELFYEIGRKLDFNPEFFNIEERFGDQKVYISNIKKIKSDIGWEPKTSISDGLDEIIHWLNGS